MNSISTIDPRFLPVTLNGRTYITSILLHKQKREGGMTKYEEHKNFIAMIRKIDCYDRLVANGDIIELNMQVVDLSTGLVFKPLMKSNSYKPLLLISPTAQKEIEHFLDDEASKDSAVKSSAVSATLDGGYGMEDAQELLKLFQDPKNLARVFTQLADVTDKVKELEVRIPQLEAERDHAIETKAHISHKGIASVVSQWGHLKTELKKHNFPVEARTKIKQKAKKVSDSLAALDLETQTRVQALVKTEAPKPVYINANDWFRAQKQTATIHKLPPKGTVSLWQLLYRHTGISFSLTFEVQHEAAMAMAETETMFIVEGQTRPSNGAPPKTVFTPYFYEGAYDEYFTNQDLLGHLKATLGKLVYRGVDVPGDVFTAHLAEIPPDHIEF